MIHYHGGPLSGAIDTQLALQGRHCMVSFEDARHVELVAEICQSFTFDNGAFSAWKRGAELDVEGYAEFCRTWHKHPGFDWYLMPDVIDGDHHDNARMRATWFNLSHGFWDCGVPVWHLHEPLQVLLELSNAFDRVAFGSSGEYAEIGTTAWWGRMSEAMDTVCDDEGRPRCKLHGLRMLDPTVFSHFPFASADSTNVARNIGIDSAWTGTYAPRSRRTRALIMMERIEAHASAPRWAGSRGGYGKNDELFG